VGPLVGGVSGVVEECCGLRSGLLAGEIDAVGDWGAEGV